VVFLDRQFWNTVLRKILSTEEVHRRGAQRRRRKMRKCATEMHREGQRIVRRIKQRIKKREE
jgi:hypothetical protein